MFTFNLPEPFARKRTHVPQQINFCKSTAAIFMLSAGEIWKAFCTDGGKRCSWEHVALSGCPRKRKKTCPYASYPDAVQTMVAYALFTSAHRVFFNSFSIDFAHRKSLMCQTARCLGLSGDFRQVAFDQIQASTVLQWVQQLKFCHC